MEDKKKPTGVVGNKDMRVTKLFEQTEDTLDEDGEEEGEADDDDEEENSDDDDGDDTLP